MLYCWLFYFCKYRGVLSLIFSVLFSIFVCCISIAWILLFCLSACESQKTPQNDQKRSWIYTLQHFDLTYYSLMDLSEKKSLLCLISFTYLSPFCFPFFCFYRQDLKYDDIMFMSSDIDYCLHFIFVYWKFNRKKKEKRGGALTPSVLPQQEVCSADSLVQVEAEMGGRERSVTLHILLTLCRGQASLCDTLGIPVRWQHTTGAAVTLRQAELHHTNHPDGGGTGIALHANNLACHRLLARRWNIWEMKWDPRR